MIHNGANQPLLTPFAVTSFSSSPSTCFCRPLTRFARSPNSPANRCQGIWKDPSLVLRLQFVTSAVSTWVVGDETQDGSQGVL